MTTQILNLLTGVVEDSARERRFWNKYFVSARQFVYRRRKVLCYRSFRVT